MTNNPAKGFLVAGHRWIRRNEWVTVIPYARPMAPWMGLLLLLSGLAVFVGYDLYADYRRIRLETDARLQYQAGFVKESIARRLQSTSNAIDAIREDLHPGQVTPRSLSALNHKLAGMTASMTGVRSLLVVNAKGIVVASNREQLIGYDYKDSDRYMAIRNAENPAELHISRPFVSPLGIRVVSVGKMIADSHGKFSGYILAILDTDHFEALMRSVLYTPNVRATLIHQDGDVILRVPDPEKVTGMNLSQQPDSLFAQYRRSGRKELMLDSHSAVTHKDLIGLITEVVPEYATVDKPLVFAALVEKSSLYTTWQRELAVRALLFASFATLAVLALVIYQRRQRAYAQLGAEKQAERQKADAQIRVIAEQLSLALDGADMGAFHWEVKTGNIVWTETYRRVFQLDASVAPCYENWLQCLLPEDREAASASVQDALKRNQDLAIEYRIRTRDDKVRWISAKGRFFCDDEGAPVRMEGLVSDITDRKMAESLLLKRNHQVELLNVQLKKRAMDAETATRAKEAFMRAISHELRTPLNHIMSASQLLVRSALDSKQQRWIDMITDASRDLLRMVTEVLDITYMAEGRLKLESIPFSPHQILGEVRLMLAHRAEAKGLPIEINVDRDLPEQMQGDPLRLSQALYNLLDNAVKFTEAGRILISASLVTRGDGWFVVRFEVADAGIGIQSEFLQELLSDNHSFRQLDDRISRQYGGLGVGLTSVRELAKLMGGELGALSEPNQGSRFWFTVCLRDGLDRQASNGVL